MLFPKSYLKKVVFGKYSFKYQSTITEMVKMKSVRKNYLHPTSKTDALTHYRKVLSLKQGIPVFQSIKPITFGSTDFGMSFKEVRKRRGSFSSYDVAKYGDNIWRRLGFKERIFSHGVKRIYHFFDDKFFFGELFFDDIRKVDEKKIAAVLLKKYVKQACEIDLLSDFRINHTDCFIYFENTGVNLSIKYICTKDSVINNKLQQITNSPSPIGINQGSDAEDVF